jgi:hypothetical protein
LRRHKYDAKRFWPELLGETVEKLYSDYVENCEGGEERT